MRDGHLPAIVACPHGIGDREDGQLIALSFHPSMTYRVRVLGGATINLISATPYEEAYMDSDPSEDHSYLHSSEEFFS